MKLHLEGVILYLGRKRRDGSRNVERIRLVNMRPLLKMLRRAMVPGRMRGKRPVAKVAEDDQLSVFDRVTAPRERGHLKAREGIVSTSLPVGSGRYGDGITVDEGHRMGPTPGHPSRVKSRIESYTLP